MRKGVRWKSASVVPWQEQVAFEAVVDPVPRRGGISAALERTHGFGIRSAMGARPGEITGMVLRNGIRVVACGVALARWISSEPWGVRTTDPWTLGAVVAILSTVGILACTLPAMRASRVDPLAALRCE